MKEIFDLANTTVESQIKGEQQLKCLTESAKFFSARFDKYQADCKKKDEMINSLEEKALGLTEKADKLSSLADRQEQYSRRNCILRHGVKENQNEGTDEVVVNKIKNEVDLEISPGYINRTHIIGVLSKGNNRLIIVTLRYGRTFTNKRRLKRKNMLITEIFTKTRMSSLKEARNKFGYNSVWRADEDEGDTKAKVYFD